MNIHRIVFSATGIDPQIHDLSGLVRSPYYLTPTSLPEGQGFYASVVVFEDNKEQTRDPLDDLCGWMTAHRSTVQNLRARKCLEIQAVMLPEQGSDVLQLDRSLLQAIESLDAEVLLQVSQLRPKSR